MRILQAEEAAVAGAVVVMVVAEVVAVATEAEGLAVPSHQPEAAEADMPRVQGESSSDLHPEAADLPGPWRPRSGFPGLRSRSLHRSRRLQCRRS